MKAPRLTMNPVLRRELVERWRTRRAVMTLTVYLGVLAGLQYLLYRVGRSVLGGFGFFGGGVDSFTAGPVLGRFLFEGLVFFVLLLVLFIAPGYAAAQVSGERERRTLALLQVTLLRPAQIVIGKLGASVAWLALLVTAALPLGAAAFFLGGVTLGDLFRGVGFIVGVGVSIAAIAIGVSSLTKRTTGSVVLTYGVVLALVAGTLFLAGVSMILREMRGEERRVPIAMYFNPFYGLADATRSGPGNSFDLPSPLRMMGFALPGGAFGAPDVMVLREEMGFEVVEPMPFPGRGGIFVDPGFGDPLAPQREPVWLQVLGIYGVLGLVGMTVAALRLRTTAGAGLALPGRRRRRDIASAPLEPEEEEESAHAS